MAKITSIRLEDIPVVMGRGRFRMPEFEAARALKPGEAIKFDCHWNHEHPGSRSCRGANRIRDIGRKENLRFHTICVDRVVYVGRLED